MPSPRNFSPSTLLLLNFALGLGTFIQILDTSIANVAIPYIAGSLSVSTDEGTWVITSFAASNAIVLPLTGWLSDYFGRVKLFVYSVVLFSLMSFFCGFAGSLTQLVIFRILQGAVAGSLIPLSQGLLLINNPPEKQGSVLGFWGMIVVVAPVLGPILGGYLCDVYTWRWIFYINIPIGLFSAFVTWYILRDADNEIVRNPIDWVGLSLLAIGVGSLQIMLDKGKDLDWFESNAIIALTIISVVSLTYFAFWNYGEKYPIVDFSFFTDRNFLLGTLITTVGYFFYFGSTVVTPLWLQTEQNYTAFWAGVAVAPVGVIPVLFSSFVGKRLSKVDVRAVASMSFLLFSISFFYQSNFITNVDLYTVMLSRFIQGFGIVLFFIPLVQVSLANIPSEKYASASGVFNFLRILVGSGFGTSIFVELWWHFQVFYHSRLAEAINYTRPLVAQFEDGLRVVSPSFDPEVVTRITDRLVEQQAYMLSTNDICWFAGWAFIVMIPIPFLCQRVKPKTAVTSAAH